MQETQVQFLGQEDPQRREWKPTPVFLPGESHGQRRRVGYSLQGCKESDTAEWPHFHSQQIFIWGGAVLLCVCNVFCLYIQFVMYSIRSKNSHLLKWGLVWNLHDPQKKPCVRCDQRTFTVTLWEALWGLMSVWGNRSLVLQCGRSQRVERDCLCLNCYQRKLPSLKHW